MFSLAPQLVVGNLRLTATGVFAEYLLSGVPFIFLSEEWQNTAAADHGELWRALPSGSSVSGLTVPVPAREIARRMLHAHPALRSDTADTSAAAWVRHCRMWQPAISRASAAAADLLAERPVGRRAPPGTRYRRWTR